MRCAESLFEVAVGTMSSELVVLLVQAERDDRSRYAEFFRHQGWLPIPCPPLAMRSSSHRLRTSSLRGFSFQVTWTASS